MLEDELIAELKVVIALANEYEVQILGYLKSARLEHGLLINFGSYRFQIRTFVWAENSATENSKNRENRKKRMTGFLSALFEFFAVK